MDIEEKTFILVGYSETQFIIEETNYIINVITKFVKIT